MSTDAEQRCDCCDLPVYSCGRAVEQGARIQAAQRRRHLLAHPRVFVAQYRGTCEKCGEWFEAGTPIMADPFQGWSEAECVVSL